ncbi:hypothetical protein OG698_42955 [Streptomyces sp. NBC_01003]|uniref:hypothetical protein n=1 Tax=Streptomyces sp. NBC_01003 TaxID=2903714 RepID=UPI0038694ECB|nr:hypothetical protein OG698_42955 [Streptomyces sp. NBC_01003]
MAALIPALRAHRLSAAQAITAGSAPRAGRGLRVQRRLGATRCHAPSASTSASRCARRGRSLLTMAAVVLAVLGALIPPRSAARLTIAKVLHNE